MRILYICTGNSFRSPTAEALTRRYHPDFEVESAGTDAVGHVAENAKELLEDVSARQYVKPDPDPVSQRALDEADQVVVMKPQHREFLENTFRIDPAKIKNWNIDDPIQEGVDPREQFEKIRERVRDL